MICIVLYLYMIQISHLYENEVSFSTVRLELMTLPPHL